MAICPKCGSSEVEWTSDREDYDQSSITFHNKCQDCGYKWDD